MMWSSNSVMKGSLFADPYEETNEAISCRRVRPSERVMSGRAYDAASNEPDSTDEERMGLLVVLMELD